MDLSTTYLGLKLKNPIVPSAGPLSKHLDSIKSVEDAGASAIVMYSLFEEQIIHESLELYHHTSENTNSFAEALTYFPEAANYEVGPEGYLEQIRKAKEAVSIPVIASLNGITKGGWIDYAKKIEQAGADALELNIYQLATDPNKNGTDIEQLYVDILTTVKSTVKIPVTMKLSPYFSALANLASRLDKAGADGLVLFNRFYQPDINLEKLEVEPSILLSTPMAMRLPLRWTAILSGIVKADIAASSGITTAEDVLKLLMAGAKVTHMMSSLLKYGVKHITEVLADLEKWMEVHEYESVKQMIGSMNCHSVANPAEFERANYMRVLNSYK
jgi:dihydroorotate dehydrogenase (fumarate)